MRRWVCLSDHLVSTFSYQSASFYNHSTKWAAAGCLPYILFSKLKGPAHKLFVLLHFHCIKLKNPGLKPGFNSSYVFINYYFLSFAYASLIFFTKSVVTSWLGSAY